MIRSFCVLEPPTRVCACTPMGLNRCASFHVYWRRVACIGWRQNIGWDRDSGYFQCRLYLSTNLNVVFPIGRLSKRLFYTCFSSNLSNVLLCNTHLQIPNQLISLPQSLPSVRCCSRRAILFLEVLSLFFRSFC
jgi:hypothetical protein